MVFLPFSSNAASSANSSWFMSIYYRKIDMGLDPEALKLLERLSSFVHIIQCLIFFPALFLNSIAGFFVSRRLGSDRSYIL